MIEFKSISYSSVSGIYADVGDRRAEVVRAFAGDYMFVPFINGKQLWCGPRTDGQCYTSKAEALKEAKMFLEGKERKLPYERLADTSIPLNCCED